MRLTETKVSRIPISACPTTERKHQFDGIPNPHFPSWNKSESGVVPDWIQKRGEIGGPGGCCTGPEVRRQNMGFRNRSVSVVDLDDLFGKVFQGLEDLNVLDNTYVIFRYPG